ncbi:C-type lectin mosGCTL-7 [Leptinotarsa decemlineata]|uniref:C-type lectin mosGCTL-7 n=1 Tax=Leptinotarsa decemlineata TaxID=7539 RepID=UPI000C252970|nr:E-selectin-like [Leptinotarsa decemlineata]
MLAKIILLGCCTFLANGALVKIEEFGGEPELPLYYFGESAYYFQTFSKATQEQGLLFCKNLDMGLVSIESKQENDFLFNTIGSLVDYTTSDFWTSGLRSGDIWYWETTGKPFSFTRWSKNEPSDNGTCLEVTQDSSDISMSWNRADCTKNNYIICEGDGNQTTTKPDSS